MRINKLTIVSVVLLIVIASLYRIIPGRPLGFAPQIAMALFGGSVIKDRKLSFLLPFLSMFFSDILFEILYQNNLSAYGGFYHGQIINYIFFAAITFIGFAIKKENVLHIFAGSIAGATAYFLLSNFSVWIGGGLDISNMPYPKNISGLISCFIAAIPFYKGSLLATFVFNTVLFGGFYLANNYIVKTSTISA